jgi:hypothetical protein
MHSTSSSDAGVLSLGAATALATAAVIQLADTQSSESTVVGVEHVSLALFSVMLLCFAPVSLVLGRRAGRPRTGIVVAAAQLVLGALAVVSNVRGEDPSFFAAVAAPANVIWLGGWILIALGLRARLAVPRLVAIGIPLTSVFALPLANVGGGLVAGAFWLVVGVLLIRGELPRTVLAPAPSPLVA